MKKEWKTIFPSGARERAWTHAKRSRSSRKRVGEDVVGQAALIERLLIALLADGHLLVEGLPGLAKTRAVKALARNLEAKFRAHPVHARTCCRPT